MLFGCSEDLYNEQINTSKFKVNYVDFKGLKKNEKLLKSLKKDRLINSNTLGRVINDTINNFSIDTDFVKHLQGENFDSYTFKILEQEGNYLDNLVLMSQTDGSYLPYIMRYSLTEQDKQALITGSPIDFTNKGKVFLLNDYNIVTDILGKYIYEEECGVVYTYEEVTTISHDPNQCDCYPPNYVTYSHVWVGNMVCTSGGGGGGDSEILTSPHGIGGGIINPCISLKKVNLKVKESLKTLSNSASTEETGEYGYSFQVNNSNILTQPIDLGYSQHDYIVIPYGSHIYGAAHTHPLKAYYMFSFSDVVVLLNLYNQANTSIKKDVVFILVNPDGSSYAIKIDDINLFTANMQQKLNATGIYGSDMLPKVIRADTQLEKEYILTSISTDSDKLARTFLEYFNGSGMSLYKSSGNFDGWKKLTLPSNPSYPSLTETPCN